MATAETLPPPATEAEKLYRFTVEDYYQMAEAGVIGPDERVELLEGQVYTMSPIGPFHGGVVDELSEFFIERSKKRYIVRVQNPVRLRDDTEPQPDIALLRRDSRYFKSQQPAAADVFLVIEVSDSTIVFDLKRKLPLYARAGIPEVWIVDLVEKEVRIFRHPGGDKYAQETRASDFASPSAFPDVTVDIANLLR